MKNYITNSKGMALAIILITFSVIAIIASITLSVAVGDVKQSVNTENFLDASYKARVAVDAIATDIERNFEALEQLKANIDAAAVMGDADAFDSAEDDYDDKWNEIYNVLKLVPTKGGVTTVHVDDVANEPIKVDVFNKTVGDEQIIEIQTVYSDGLYTSNAKIRLGTFESEDLDYEIPAFDGKNVLYSWGEMEIGNGSPSIDGYISSGGKATSKKVKVNTPDERNLSIIPPPSTILSIDKEGSTKKANIIAGNKVTLTKEDSGYYGDLNTGKLDLVVNTEDADVTIILNSLTIGKNGGKIEVQGEKNFYVYFVEDYDGMIESNNIMGGGKPNENNHLTIEGLNSKGNAQTYFISYNDYMQKWVSEHEGDEKYLIPKSEIKTMDILDNYVIKNGPVFNAYLYLPFGNVEVRNSSGMKGSLYATKLNMGNSPNLDYLPFNKFDPLYTYGGDSTMGNPIAEVVTTYNLSKNKIWLK